MRLPISSPLVSRDGAANKDARLTNMLKEDEKAIIRPGLVLNASASGVGNGIVAFNNELVSVYGSTLGVKRSVMTVSPISFGTPFPGNATIFGYSYANSVYVAVGIDNVTGVDSLIYSSTDGLSWTLRKTVSNALLYAVATDGDKFVAVGGSSIFASSTDGITWSTYAFAPGGDCGTIIWDGTYFLIESSGLFYRSTDAVTWTAVGEAGTGTIPPVGYNNTHIATSGDKTIVIDEDYISGDSWLWVTSDHGSTWTRGGTDVTNPMSVCYGNGSFCCFGTDGVDTVLVYSSPDGLTYTKTAEVKMLTGMGGNVSSYSNGVFIVSLGWSDTQASGGYITSENLTDWSVPVYYAGLDGNEHYYSVAVTPTGFLFGVDTVSSLLDIDRTIPTVTTVTEDRFDFAQSPL